VSVDVAAPVLRATPAALPVEWIDDQAALAECCQRWLQKPYLAIDTEFERVKTFYPILALIQVCDGERISLIDAPLIKKWTDFVVVLESTAVLKVMHAASEDLETLYQTCGGTLTHFYDSQAALAFLNQGLSMGYAALVAQTYGVTLSKDAARTDWLARPLSDEQWQYAAADVSYLFDLWPALQTRVEQQQRIAWLHEEAQSAMTRAKALESEDTAYRRVKQAFLLRAQELAVAKALASWREITARETNTARSRLLRDEALITLSQRQPKNWAALAGLELLHPHSLRVHGQAILNAIESGRGASELPPPILRIIDLPVAKKLAAALSDAVSAVAQRSDLQAEWLMSRRIQEQLAIAIAEQYVKAPVSWCGWRRELLRETMTTVLISQAIALPTWW
jgi:ribonuclease D